MSQLTLSERVICLNRVATALTGAETNLLAIEANGSIAEEVKTGIRAWVENTAVRVCHTQGNAGFGESIFLLETAVTAMGSDPTQFWNNIKDI